MTRIDYEYEAGYAKRQVVSALVESSDTIRAKIRWIRDCLTTAERALDRGDAPNACGVIQGAACELEMAVARYHALREFEPTINTLATHVEDAYRGVEE